MPPLLRALTSQLSELVVPAICLGCDARLGGTPAPMLLCSRCRGQLQPLRLDRHCLICLRPLPKAGGARLPCLACQLRRNDLDQVDAVWRYAFPLDRVVRALKFGRVDALAAQMARETVGRVGWTSLEPIDLVVPVPLAGLRRLVRGFNQAELLARELARQQRLPWARALVRCGLGLRPQATRGGRARRRPGGVRFRARRRIPLDGLSILLVDDVFTTGTTLGAAARSLRASGARRVVALTLAATLLKRAQTPA